MRAILALLITLPSVGVAALPAQADYYGRIGLTFSTKLVKDEIINQVDVTPGLAPTLFLGAALPIAPSYRAGLEAALATSGFHSTEQNVDTDLGTFRTITLALGLDGPVWRHTRWRVEAGVIRYWPADEEGIFAQGGTTRFLAGAGVDYRPPLWTSWDLLLSLRYDFHRFTTDELRARGFTGNQGVQRVSASVGLARAHR